MKKWYHSKTIWVNGIAIAILGVQAMTSFVIRPEEQAAFLIVVNLILRAVTKEELGK